MLLIYMYSHRYDNAVAGSILKLGNLILHPLQVVYRYRDSQFHWVKNTCFLIEFKSIYICLK